MKKIVLFLVLSIAFTTNTFSKDKTEDLKELIDLMQVEKMVEGKITAMIPMMKQQMGKTFEGESGERIFNEYMVVLIEETKVMTNKLVDNEVIAIYDKHFTHKEIKEMIKFYKSSIGQKMLEKNQDITQEMMDAMTSSYLPDFQQRLTVRLQEIISKE